MINVLIYFEGFHNLQLSLDGLGSQMFFLESAHAQNLKLSKILQYITIVKSKKGKKAGENLGNYIITVKAKFLFLETMYYIYKEDYIRLEKEYENFNK